MQSYVAAHLLEEEKRKGENSFWQPYVRVLPSAYPTMPLKLH
jgi:hypothetical protein